MADLKIHQGDAAVAFATNTFRPADFTKDGVPLMRDSAGALQLAVNDSTLATNAYLNREEWERLDRAVYEMARERLNMYQDMINAGLSDTGDIAAWYTKWRVSSERTAAQVTMDFRTQGEYDRTDRLTYGVPVPIISAAYKIGRRELLTSRRLGQPIDVAEAREAGLAVGEMAEKMLIDGDTSIVVNGGSIPGVRTLTGRLSSTAAALGGGDFGTITNIRPTFTGMLSSFATNRYYGPFTCYIASTQYYQMLARYTDGSGQTALETVLALREILDVKPNDLITTAGELLAVQMTPNVAQIEVAMTLENRRWQSADGSEFFFAAMMSAVPKLKADYAGNAGIGHITSC